MLAKSDGAFNLHYDFFSPSIESTILGLSILNAIFFFNILCIHHVFFILPPHYYKRKLRTTTKKRARKHVAVKKLGINRTNLNQNGNNLFCKTNKRKQVEGNGARDMLLQIAILLRIDCGHSTYKLCDYGTVCNVCTKGKYDSWLKEKHSNKKTHTKQHES